MIKANDKYSALLTAGYTVGQNTLSVTAVPDNVPTYVTAAKGTDNETVFSVTGKTTNSLTGVTRVRGANVNLDAQTPLTCLNNEDFINQFHEAATGKATGAEIDTGTEDAKIVTPKAIADSGYMPAIDEDDMASDLDTKVPTQQSVKAYVDSQTNTTGWTADTDTWVYVAANQFKIEGKDVTARFPKGTKLKFTQTSAKYAIVSAAAFSTDTTVTIVTNNDYTIANAAIESPYYSYQASPQGFPGYFNYTPTLSRSGGAYDNAPTLNSATYSVNGRTATVCVRYTLHATPGSSGTMIVTQPTGLVTANNTVIAAWNGSSGVAMTGNCNTNGNINIYKYDGLAEATGGDIYQVTAIYHT